LPKRFYRRLGYPLEGIGFSYMSSKVPPIGYYISHRSLFTHWLWEKRKLSKWEAWHWLIAAVNFEDKLWFDGKEQVIVKRGEIITSLNSLSQEWLWAVHDTRSFLKKLTVDHMISTETNTRYTKVIVCNYDTYQNISQTKSKRITNVPQTDSKHLANVPQQHKEINNINTVNTIIVPPTPNGEDILLVAFDEFRILYPGSKRGLQTEFDNFKKKHSDWKEVIPTLVSALQKQIKSRDINRERGAFVPEWKMFHTYINGRHWETEIPLGEPQSQNKTKTLAEQAAQIKD
jgi:hypothetical protein